MTKTIPFETFVRTISIEGTIFGGYVRDYLLGVEPTDIDIMVPDILRTVQNLSANFTVEVLPSSEYGKCKGLKHDEMGNHPCDSG